jgi:hypothetical protein
VYATLAARLPKDTLVTFGAGNYAIWPQRFLIYRDFPARWLDGLQACPRA